MKTNNIIGIVTITIFLMIIILSLIHIKPFADHPQLSEWEDISKDWCDSNTVACYSGGWIDWERILSKCDSSDSVKYSPVTLRVWLADSIGGEATVVVNRFKILELIIRSQLDDSLTRQQIYDSLAVEHQIEPRYSEIMKERDCLRLMNFQNIPRYDTITIRTVNFSIDDSVFMPRSEYVYIPPKIKYYHALPDSSYY